MNATQDYFLLPDLVSHCSYPLRINPNCDEIARQSEQWLLTHANHSEKKRQSFLGLKAGELTAACYPRIEPYQLGVCDDFMNWLFNLDDWLDEFDVEGTFGMAQCCIDAMRDPAGFQTDKRAGIMTKDFFGRFTATSGPANIERFIYTMQLFFDAVAQQASDRAQGVIPDLESYIAMRRDTSGVKPCFVLTAWSAGFELPEEVATHHVITTLEDAANDLITWSNDIFSYNVEQSRNDTHNMISVMMDQQGMSLQQAVDFVGDLCKQSIDRFEAARSCLPSWSSEVDRNVQIYVEGMQDWIVGSLHWSFDTERYFGKMGQEVKEKRIVALLPKKP
ncbi:terpenoid synthase [Dendrothele bispora CBS 962.96]|uniref:Terpene synthase n=1 Tax=Dendrothele bispora (strain CBS 962.96) TaxID=1314807 RepID=A0A4S8L197_DENBC|nr:terpenoid synthase [Dendrothele bispora CBS 962.96]